MDELDSMIAVIAHGLLGSLAALNMALEALKQQDLSPEQRSSLLDAAQRQTDHVVGVLRDLIAGTPPEITQALNIIAIRGEVGTAGGDLLG